MIDIWDKTCADCNWNAVCTHKKILWDGQEYKYVTACCRAMNGRTFIPSSLPDEPQDWYLWRTIRGFTIYGRAQFIYITEEDMGLDVVSASPSHSRAPKIFSSTTDLAQRNTMAKPLAGLKSVYKDAEDIQQGSLF